MPNNVNPDAHSNVFSEIDRLLETMIEQQRQKVLATARAKVPHLTPEDVMNPEAYPAIYEDGPFNFEDGILTGLLSAQMAIRAHARGK
jgi:hypothetical protein